MYLARELFGLFEQLWMQFSPRYPFWFHNRYDQVGSSYSTRCVLTHQLKWTKFQYACSWNSAYTLSVQSVLATVSFFWIFICIRCSGNFSFHSHTHTQTYTYFNIELSRIEATLNTCILNPLNRKKRYTEKKHTTQNLACNCLARNGNSYHTEKKDEQQQQQGKITPTTVTNEQTTTTVEPEEKKW